MKVNYVIEHCQKSFADVHSQLQFEHEKEILFTISSVFRIESMTKIANDMIWNAHLIAITYQNLSMAYDQSH